MHFLFKKDFQIINICDLAKLKIKNIDPEKFLENDLKNQQNAGNARLSLQILQELLKKTLIDISIIFNKFIRFK